LALTSNADITKGSISNLIASNALPFTDGLDFPVYSVNSRSNLATGAYNALGESVQIVTEDFDKYQFVAVAEDGVGEMGVGYQVGGGLSVQSASILRTILDTVTFDPTGIAFTGSVIADENNTTNYYTLATTDPNLSRLQVVDLIENSPTSVASIGSNISANSNVVTDSILTQIVDVNSNVYSATAVNKAYVYTYAIDVSGSNNHRDIDMKTVDGTNPTITRISDQNAVNTSATRTTSPTFVGGETMALSYTLANGDIVYMSSDGSDGRDGAHLFDGNTTGDWTNASHGAGGVPMTWAYKFTGSKKYVNQMKFWQAPNTHPAGNITISYYDESTTTWKNVTSPDKTGFNNSVAPVYAESITINFDGFISDYWKIIVDKHPSSPYPNLVGLYEWEIYGSDNITGVLVPYVKYDTIVQPTSPESGLTISDATVFSSVANIDKYYAFNLVTGVPVTPGTDSFVNPTTLTDEDIITFTQTYLENQANISSVGWSSYPATGGGELSVYSGSNIQQYAIEQVPNMTFTHAFNTLTPTDSSSLSSITNVAEWAFSSYMVAVDTAQRYGLRAENSVYYILRVDRRAHVYVTYADSIHWGGETITLKSGLRITNTDPIFVDMIVHSSTRGGGWNGGMHISGHGGYDMNVKTYVILKSSKDDPIASFSFNSDHGVIISYTILKHTGAPLADWDKWVTTGYTRVIADVQNPNPEPDLPSDGNWEVLKSITNQPARTRSTYP
jgi:hypothetical protein